MMDKAQSFTNKVINAAEKTVNANHNVGIGSNQDEYSKVWEKVLQMNEMELMRHPVGSSYKCAALRQQQHGQPSDEKRISWAAVMSIAGQPNQVIGTFNSKLEAIRRATCAALILHGNTSNSDQMNSIQSPSSPPLPSPSPLNSCYKNSSLLPRLSSSSQLQNDVLKEKSDGTNFEQVNVCTGKTNDHKSICNMKSHRELNPTEVRYSCQNALVALDDNCEKSQGCALNTRTNYSENGQRLSSSYLDSIQSKNFHLNERKTTGKTQKVAFGDDHDGLKVKACEQDKCTLEILRKDEVKDIMKNPKTITYPNHEKNCKIQHNFQKCPRKDSDAQIKLSAGPKKKIKLTDTMISLCSTNEFNPKIAKQSVSSTMTTLQEPDLKSYPNIASKSLTTERLTTRIVQPQKGLQNLESSKSNEAKEEYQILNDSLKSEILKCSKIPSNGKSISFSHMIDEDTNQNADNESFVQSQDLDNLFPNSNPLEMSDPKTRKVLDIFFSCYQAQRETGISRYMLGQACRLGGGVIKKKFFRYLSKNEFKQLVNPDDNSVSYAGYSIHKSAQFNHILTHIAPKSKFIPSKDSADNQALQSFTTACKRAGDCLTNSRQPHEKNVEDVSLEVKSLKRKDSAQQSSNTLIGKEMRSIDVEDDEFNSLIIKPLNPKRYTKRVKKYVELVENKTNKVIICFRGNLDAGLALDLDRKKVGRACQSYGAPFEIKFSGFHLRYKSTGLKMEAYEYGKHKEDFMHIDETHEERLARWQKTFENDQLNCPLYKRENAMREEKKKLEQNNGDKVEDSNESTDVNSQNTNGVASEDKCDNRSQRHDISDDRSHDIEKNENGIQQQDKSQDISKQNDKNNVVSQQQTKCQDGEKKAISIDSTENLLKRAMINEEVRFKSNEREVKTRQKKVKEETTKTSEQTIPSRRDMEMESEEIPISSLMKEGAYERTSISRNIHPCTPVILRKISKENVNDSLCVVCQIKKAKIIFLPCNHCVICGSCNDEKACPTFCPFCRMPIDRRLETHIATYVRPRIYSAYSFI